MRIVITTLLLCAAFPLLAQTCFSGIAATANYLFFTVNNDGTVVDNRTGIMWSRCSLGQSWNTSNSSCAGGAEQTTWQQALVLAQQFELAGYSDWQLPNIKELSTIVERQCVDAAINESIFPNTLPQNYWTNTSGVGSSEMAWAVAFYSGKSNLRNKASDVYIRVMRYAK